MEWISVSKELPAYGEPVLISIKGTVQNVTYTLDGDEDNECPDWFEPYHFDHDDNQRTFCFNVSHWSPLPPPPKL